MKRLAGKRLLFFWLGYIVFEMLAVLIHFRSVPSAIDTVIDMALDFVIVWFIIAER